MSRLGRNDSRAPGPTQEARLPIPSAKLLTAKPAREELWATARVGSPVLAIPT